MKAFSLNCSAYLLNESLSSLFGKWGLPLQEAGQLKGKALISRRYQTVNLLRRHLSVLLFYFLTCSSLSLYYLVPSTMCQSAFFLSSQLSLKAMSLFQWCVFFLFFPIPFHSGFTSHFLHSISSFCLPPQTSVGLLASNNPCNSRVIKKHLSGGTSWPKACNKKLVWMTRIASFSVYVCWGCATCICTVMALCPAAADCMDNNSRGLICPPFFPHIYTQYQSVTKNCLQRNNDEADAKNDVHLKNVYFSDNLRLDVKTNRENMILGI